MTPLISKLASNCFFVFLSESCLLASLRKSFIFLLALTAVSMCLRASLFSILVLWSRSMERLKTVSGLDRSWMMPLAPSPNSANLETAGGGVSRVRDLVRHG